MRKIWTIGIKTYKQYFVSPAAYIVALALFFIIGMLFNADLGNSISAQLQGSSSTPSVQQSVWLLFYLFIFAMPALTSWLIADENRLGTLELLFTSPVKDYELVIGKWLGAFLCTLTFAAISWVYPLFLYLLVKPPIDQGPLVSSYVVLIFAFGALVSFGLFTSSLFSNSTAAFFAAFGISLILFLFDTLATVFVDASSSAMGATSAATEILSYISWNGHFRSTALMGKLDIRDIVYYASWIIFMLFVTTRVVESKRWR